MLRQAYKDVKKNYYDPQFHDVDLDATYREYDTKLNSAHTMGESFRIIAAFLSHLHDSHVFFIPPSPVNRSVIGFHMEMVGDNCFITRVRPKTDANTKLHVGDRVLALDGYNVGRQDFSDLQYFLNVLAPASTEQLNVSDTSGVQRQELVHASYHSGKAVLDITGTGSSDNDLWNLIRQGEDDAYNSRDRIAAIGDVIVWKIPRFYIDPTHTNSVFSTAKNHKTLILDLRGNPGGSIETLKEVLSHLFDREVKLGDRISRKESKPEIAKGSRDAFTGKLIVLIDSQSASAAEILARVVQIEHRGTVIGDRSEGAVMEALHYPESIGTDTRIFYGFSITSANLIMTDGKSLEGTGVTPDEIMLLTASDLTESRDSVLSHAIELGGASISPSDAGKLFPFNWPDI